LKKSLHAATTSWQPIRGELVANASGVFTFATGSGAVRLSDPRRTILAAGREVPRIPNDDDCCHQHMHKIMRRPMRFIVDPAVVL
jgi:hypothetical protein